MDLYPQTQIQGISESLSGCDCTGRKDTIGKKVTKRPFGVWSMTIKALDKPMESAGMDSIPRLAIPNIFTQKNAARIRTNCLYLILSIKTRH
jgi:hypothetical protein